MILSNDGRGCASTLSIKGIACHLQGRRDAGDPSSKRQRAAAEAPGGTEIHGIRSRAYSTGDAENIQKQSHESREEKRRERVENSRSGLSSSSPHLDFTHHRQHALACDAHVCWWATWSNLIGWSCLIYKRVPDSHIDVRIGYRFQCDRTGYETHVQHIFPADVRIGYRSNIVQILLIRHNWTWNLRKRGADYFNVSKPAT